MTMKQAYTRNIAMYDIKRGGIWGITSVATIAQDLDFWAGYSDDPTMHDACKALADEYINGNDLGKLDDLEETVGIHLYTC